MTNPKAMTVPYRFSDLSDTVAVLGAGLSVAARVPQVSELSEKFLNLNGDRTQHVIIANLLKFWDEVFGYEAGKAIPLFEDHFTLLDLAANVGHNLGPQYTPALLRALRRISIHRVFEILNSRYRPSQEICTFLKMLVPGRSALVSLNWDTVVEAHLSLIKRHVCYGIRGEFLDDAERGNDPLTLIKLHGSANWHYCDSCHTTLFGRRGDGKSLLTNKTFLEPADFRKLADRYKVAHGAAARRMFADSYKVADELENKPGTKCKMCHNPKTTARVATFSYAKAFDFFPYHASWDRALTELRAARRWIFIGYSLPDADFAFKHLLKTAQLASEAPKEVFVIDKCARDAPVVVRYKQFFGRVLQPVFTGGFEKWVCQVWPR